MAHCDPIAFLLFSCVKAALCIKINK